MGRIDHIFAFVQEDTGPDDEGVILAPIEMPRDFDFHGHLPMPLVGGDMARVDSMRPAAQAIANAQVPQHQHMAHQESHVDGTADQIGRFERQSRTTKKSH